MPQKFRCKYTKSLHPLYIKNWKADNFFPGITARFSKFQFNSQVLWVDWVDMHTCTDTDTHT